MGRPRSSCGHFTRAEMMKLVVECFGFHRGVFAWVVFQPMHVPDIFGLVVGCWLGSFFSFSPLSRRSCRTSQLRTSHIGFARLGLN